MQQLQKWSTAIGALGVALIVGGFLLRLITSTRNDVLLLMVGLGIVLIGFYIITRPRDAARQSANMRVGLQGVNVLVLALAVLGIVGAVNFIAFRQFHQRLDLTANQAHTLSQQTVQVLESLQTPVQVTAFFTPSTLQQKQQAEEVLKEYQLKTDKLVVQFVDPDENPALAQKYDNARAGAVVFEKDTRTEKVYDTYDENSFTNAILKVTQTQQPAIYFTTGHGEYSPTDFQETGLGAIVDYLKQVNYKVEPLNLATISNTLPADTSALVIAGPTKPFSPEDEKRVGDYLNQGGRVLIMSDPNTSVGMTDTLKAWGLEMQKDLILDPGLNYRGNAPIPVFGQFPSSPVTENLDKYGVYLPGASSIKETNQDGKTATALFTTTADACAKTDFTKLQDATQLACDAGDAKGPFMLGYTVEGAPTGTKNVAPRLIVLGNASFATNHWMNNQDSLGNQLLFGNMVNWLAGQEQLIAIPPRDPGVRPLTTLTGGDYNLIFGTSVIILPLASLIIGGILWWRKR